ncbi:MAG: metallophosphoesterase family protein, partial [Candidatus Heimdallarchaeaceae archaeon]
LYDMVISASIDGVSSTHKEIHSIKVVPRIKDSYNFIVLGDPQFHRDGSSGKDYRNEKTGVGNFTDLLKEINLLNPEFIIVLGDLTEWTDEIALLKYPKWLDLYLDNVPFVAILGNHGDFEATATTPTAWEWGSGKGIWKEVIGPSHGIFWYGDHAFILGDSSSPTFDSVPEEMDFLETAIDTAKSSASMITLSFHHPLSDYGGNVDETIKGSTENSQIKSWLKSAKAAAYFHGHWHEDLYDEISGMKHIGTTESVGDNPGYRLITVENDEISDFSYGTVDLSTYSAPSWPINMIKATYGLNDGTETSATAYLWNGLNHDITNAHLRFIMDPSNEYVATGGSVVNSFIENGARIVDVELNVSATTNHSVSLEIYIPLTTTNSTTTQTTAEGSTDSIPVAFVIPTIIAAIIFRRKRNSRNE